MLQISLRRQAGSTLEIASRYASIQKVFNDQLREWHWQRNLGTKYLRWKPPGILLCQYKKDYWDIGTRNQPDWKQWGFVDEEGAQNEERRGGHVEGDLNQSVLKKGLGSDRRASLSLEIGCGSWALQHASQNPMRNWVIVEWDDNRLFSNFLRALDVFEMEPDELTLFPNIRFLFSYPRFIHRFFSPKMFDSIHVHFPECDKQGRNFIDSSMISIFFHLLKEGGELHIVDEGEDGIKAHTATMNRVRECFDPSFQFPFYSSLNSRVYGRLVRTSVTGSRAGRKLTNLRQGNKSSDLFHSKYTRLRESGPNFRFSDASRKAIQR